MAGKLYGVGVGPGDPELMTLKAFKTIQECGVIAVPDTGAAEKTAFLIAQDAGLDMAGKTLLTLSMPMTRDQAALAACHRQATKEIAGNLSGGRDVAFLTLGDPTVYSTYMYIHKNIVRMGYAAEIIPGVPSFCAAAARLGVPLAEGGQALHVIPASYGGAEGGLELPGTKVFMKSGKAFVKMKEILEKTGRLRAAKAVQRCGMRQERVWQDMASADADASYFSIIIVKDEE